MTAADCDTILALVLAEDLAAQDRTERLATLARIVMREHPTLEGRTAARIAVLDLERKMEPR